MSSPTSSAHDGCYAKSCKVIDKLAATSPRGADRARALEFAVADVLSSWGMGNAHHPTVGFFTIDGSELEPDVGALAGEAPVVYFNDQPIDTLVEVKLKDCPGSADLKIEKSLSNYAHACDELGTTALLVAALCPASTPQQRIDAIEREAANQLVAFVMLEDLTYEVVVQKLEKTAARRQEIRTQQTYLSLADRFDADVLAAALRELQRRAVQPL